MAILQSKVWDEITNPFPNFNIATIEVWEWISNFIPHFTACMCDYLYMLGLKIIHGCHSELRSYWFKNI